MIDAAAVGDIITLYEKHGWKLRRALLSGDERKSLEATLNSIDIVESDLSALWFSRRSTPESEAWELRRLTGSPFALVAVVPADAPSDEVEATLAQVLEEMRAKSIA